MDLIRPHFLEQPELTQEETVRVGAGVDPYALRHRHMDRTTCPVTPNSGEEGRVENTEEKVEGEFVITKKE